MYVYIRHACVINLLDAGGRLLTTQLCIDNGSIQYREKLGNQH